VSKVKSLTRKR